jgi:hypothetical protein
MQTAEIIEADPNTHFVDSENFSRLVTAIQEIDHTVVMSKEEEEEAATEKAAKRSRGSRSPVYPFSNSHLSSHNSFMSSGQYTVSDFETHLTENILPKFPELTSSASEPLKAEEESKNSVGIPKLVSAQSTAGYVLVRSKSNVSSHNMLLSRMALQSPPVVANPIETPLAVETPTPVLISREMERTNSTDFGSICSDDMMPL